MRPVAVLALLALAPPAFADQSLPDSHATSGDAEWQGKCRELLKKARSVAARKVPSFAQANVELVARPRPPYPSGAMELRLEAYIESEDRWVIVFIAGVQPNPGGSTHRWIPAQDTPRWVRSGLAGVSPAYTLLQRQWNGRIGYIGANEQAPRGSRRVLPIFQRAADDCLAMKRTK
ncbi:MAG: hypothetical protein EXR72_08470 [Myxococcales bacterium]|nr:hypothetical protein [Myxococcales bacterium]